MRYFPVTLCALLFAVPAKADKFWLADPASQKNAAAGSSPDYVEGVLLAESDEGYHVRVVGGELVLPKKSVFRIEKDGLSIDAILKAERDAAAGREAAEKERRLAQAAARASREAKAVEASASRAAPVAAEVAPAIEAAPVFDPVIGVALQEAVDPLRAARLAWDQTRDRAYMRTLRQLRRQR